MIIQPSQQNVVCTKKIKEDKREVGSTYAGNTENELVVVMHFNKDVI